MSCRFSWFKTAIWFLLMPMVWPLVYFAQAEQAGSAAGQPVENLQAGDTPEQDVYCIIIIRHAQSLANALQIYNSQPNHPDYFPAFLTEVGQTQSIELGRRLAELGIRGQDVHSVISSPLPRTIETAELMMEALGLNPEDSLTFDTRLIERCFGSREGQPYRNYREWDHWNPASPESFKGETSEQVAVRMMEVWVWAQEQVKYGHVLMVSHGQPIDTFIKALTGRGLRLRNAEYVVLSPDGIPLEEAALFDRLRSTL